MAIRVFQSRAGRPACVGNLVVGHTGGDWKRVWSVSGLTASRRLVLVLLILAAASILFRFTEDNTQQSFAASGAAKRVLLPLSYAIVVAAAVLPPRHQDVVVEPRGPLPFWIWCPTAVISLSFLVNLFSGMVRPDGQLAVPNVAQGLGLFGGFTLIAWFGWHANRWDTRSRDQLLAVLIAASALAAGVFRSTGLTPLIVLIVPSTFACLSFALTQRRQRGIYVVLFLTLGVLGFRSLQPNPSIPVSQAVIGQIGACIALLLIWLLPVGLRVPLTLLGMVTGIYFFFQLGGLRLMVGDYISSDVTIGQRSYEAAQVFDRLGASALAPFVGLGPGGTVNLVNSPDAGTLFASGRDLAGVDDVHLLPAYLALKLGSLAIVWVATLTYAVAMVYGAVICAPRRDPWSFSMLLFIIAGAVDALPAATNLLTNPLIPLFLGLLWARTRIVRGRWEPATAHTALSIADQSEREPS